MSGWIGVDFDGTLCEYPGTFGVPHEIGKPIPKMVARVKQWLSEGKEVRVFTARAAGPFVDTRGQDIGEAAALLEVQDWCKIYIGQVLPITCRKDYNMIELWDDRAVQVYPNTGIALQEYVEALETELDSIDSDAEDRRFN